MNLNCIAVLTCSVAAIALVAPSSAKAQDRQFNVPSGPAAKTIPELARQAGVQIVAPVSDLRNVRTPAITGSASIHAALAKLIAGTGLEIASDNGSTVVLRRQGAAQGSDRAPTSPVGSAEQDAEESEEIVVTAQKREEPLQKVPLSMTAYTGEALERNGIKTLTDLSNSSPSLIFAEGQNAREARISIRGLGTDGLNAGVDNSVGIYLDGVYIPRPAGLIGQLPDVETIELLRGPQGTLYGVNTPAGVININTRNPTDQFEGRLTLEAGNFGYHSITGYASGGLADGLTGRITAWSSRDHGYVNLKTGGHGNSRDQWGVRGKVHWTPSDNWKLTFTADYTSVTAHCCEAEWIDISDEALATFDRMATNLGYNRSLYFPSREGDGYNGRGEKLDNVSYSDGNGWETFKQLGLALKSELSFASGHQLTTIGAYRDWNSNQVTDNDEFGIDTSAFGPQPERSRTYSLETRLLSPRSKPVEYILGAYLLKTEANFDQGEARLAPGCLYNRDTQLRVDSGKIPDTVAARSRCVGWYRADRWDQDALSLSAFGELTVNLTDRLSVIGGGRITYDRKKATKTQGLFGPDRPQNGFGEIAAGTPFYARLSNTEATWSLTVKENLSNSVMIYARAAKGYKAPGVNARPIRVANIPTTFGPETSVNYEAGIKSRIGSVATLNLTAFMIQFNDLQLAVSNPQADPSGLLGTYIQNAGALTSKGIEAEMSLKPVRGVRLSGAVTYLDSKYDRFRGTPCADGGNSAVPRDAINPSLCDQSGLRPAATPEWRFTLGSELNFPLAGTSVEWFGGSSSTYTSSQYMKADLDFRSFQAAYWLHDIYVGIRDQERAWQVRAWMKNAGDSRYLLKTDLAGYAAINGVRGSFYGYYARPRSFGLETTFSF